MQVHPDVQAHQSEIGGHLAAIASLLPPQFRVTLVIRNTVFPDQYHAVVTNELPDTPAEDVAGVIMMVDKQKKQGA